MRLMVIGLTEDKRGFVRHGGISDMDFYICDASVNQLRMTVEALSVLPEPAKTELCAGWIELLARPEDEGWRVFDYSTYPDRGDALDHLDEGWAGVIALHLYGLERGAFRPPVPARPLFYGPKNGELLEMCASRGLPLLVMGDQPTGERAKPWVSPVTSKLHGIPRTWPTWVLYYAGEEVARPEFPVKGCDMCSRVVEHYWSFCGYCGSSLHVEVGLK